MLTGLFGNITAEKVLLYLENYQEGYAKRISDTFSIPLNMVQKQLVRLEEGGVLVSQRKGKTLLYVWNPRFPFRNELKSLLQRALEIIPPEEKKAFYRQRQRPGG